MNITSASSIRRGVFFFACLTLVVVSALLIFFKNSTTSGAADARNFKAGNIMSDAVMTNKSSMSEAQVQAFLLSKNTCDDTNIAKAAQYPQYQYNIKNGKFVCLAEESFNGESASKIIWQAAQDYNINPQVLIVLLQKEQGLITDTWPNNIQYRSATGYGCPDNADCNGKYFGFKNQVRNAANFFHAYQTGNTAWYKLVWPGDKYTGAWQPFSYNLQYHPNLSCGTALTLIENRATASLYSYTPYRPNQAALNAQTGTGDSCSSYGNRNFWVYFSDWFGNTTGTIYNGLDFSTVFNADYYLSRYSDLRAVFGDDKVAAFDHFVTNGMIEGRQAIEGFDVLSYRAQNPDLRLSFGNNLVAYFEHYVLFGYKEKRTTIGNQKITYTSSYGGKNYSAVYDFETYVNNYTDIKKLYANDEIGALSHFIAFGMKEGRIASNSFNIQTYLARYVDLRNAFGNDLKAYYLHYMADGKREGRVATGDIYYDGTSTYNKVDYSLVYNYNYYITHNPDIKAAFGLDDKKAIEHFFNNGMKEGRRAKDSFNVSVYRNKYADLQRAFGGNLKLYYIHFMEYGNREGRTAD